MNQKLRNQIVLASDEAILRRYLELAFNIDNLMANEFFEKKLVKVLDNAGQPLFEV